MCIIGGTFLCSLFINKKKSKKKIKNFYGKCDNEKDSCLCNVTFTMINIFK